MAMGAVFDPPACAMLSNWNNRLHPPLSRPAMAIGRGDLEVGRGRPRPRRFLGFTWPELKLMCCVVAVLCLAINGGAVLPIAGVFSATGIVCATLLMIIIALANVYTNDILLWQAHAVRRKDYETLSEAVGGAYWKFLTEVGLVILMIGTLISGIQQIGESMAAGVTFIEPNYTGVFVEGSGRLIMVISVVAVCAPLVFLKGLSQLELAGDAGIVINQVLVIVVLVNAISHGMPYTGVKGEFEVVGFTTLTYVLVLVGTYGYAFYIQPFSMAMLEELPRGQRAVQILSWGTTITILGTGAFVYWTVGFFGASLIGFAAYDTSNTLEDPLGGDGKAQGALNIIYTLYLILSMPPFEYVTRHSMMKWWASLAKHFKFMDCHMMIRKVVLAFLIYGFSLGISLAIPGESGKVITVTGAAGSGLVCYFIPIVNHFALYFKLARCMRQGESEGSFDRKARIPSRGGAEDSVEINAGSRPIGSAGLHHIGTNYGADESVHGGLHAADVGHAAKELVEEQPEIDEEDDAEPYFYPSWERDGFKFWTVVTRILFPLTVLGIGVFVAVATLVTINEA